MQWLKQQVCLLNLLILLSKTLKAIVTLAFPWTVLSTGSFAKPSPWQIAITVYIMSPGQFGWSVAL